MRAWLSGLHVPTLLLPWAAAIGLCFGLCVKYGLWLAYGAIPPSSLIEVVVILDYFLFYLFEWLCMFIVVVLAYRLHLQTSISLFE